MMLTMPTCNGDRVSSNTNTTEATLKIQIPILATNFPPKNGPKVRSVAIASKLRDGCSGTERVNSTADLDQGRPRRS